MPKANTENRHLPGHVPDQRNQDPRFTRRARARRKQDALGLQRFHFFYRQLVVAADLNVGPKFAEVLNEVVGEGIVVIENEDHG